MVELLLGSNREVVYSLDVLSYTVEVLDVGRRELLDILLTQTYSFKGATDVLYYVFVGMLVAVVNQAHAVMRTAHSGQT